MLGSLLILVSVPAIPYLGVVAYYKFVRKSDLPEYLKPSYIIGKVKNESQKASILKKREQAKQRKQQEIDKKFNEIVIEGFQNEDENDDDSEGDNAD